MGISSREVTRGGSSNLEAGMVLAKALRQETMDMCIADECLVQLEEQG